jgi:hypothetical protein
LVFPNKPKIETIVINDIIVDMSGGSTLVREPKLEPTSFNQLAHKYMPYHHPHHKIKGMEMMTFKYLQRRMKDKTVD